MEWPLQGQQSVPNKDQIRPTTTQSKSPLYCIIARIAQLVGRNDGEE